MGDDPTESQAMDIKIDSDLLKRWTPFAREGLKKAEIDSLLKKYTCVKDLEAPILNPQIATTMKEFAIAQEYEFYN